MAPGCVLIPANCKDRKLAATDIRESITRDRFTLVRSAA